MSVDVIWDDAEQTMLRYHYAGEWSWGDAFRSIDRARGMMIEAGHTVDCIIDMRNTRHFPDDNAVMYISRMGEIGQHMVNFSGVNVYVDADRFLKMVLNIYRQLNPDESTKPLSLLHVATLEEAHALIRQMRDQASV